MLEQKIKEENIENNLVFSIDRRKRFALKSTQTIIIFFFRNPSHENKIIMSIFISVFYFGLFIKP